MFQIRAKLVYNKKVKDNYFHLALEAHRIAKLAWPGQFVNIRVNDGCRPLLRRPFSIHRVSGSSIEILYEVLGEGTEILSRKRPGEYSDIIGPLGKGFDFQLHASGRRLHVLVAGGAGVAPLTFLAEKLAEVKSLRHKAWRIRQEVWRKKSKIKTLVLIGARTKDRVLCEKEFRNLACSVKIATDDGSRGFKGKITELLEEILVVSHKLQVTNRKSATCNLQPATIYACGPRPMLKEITAISKQHNIGTQISLEEHMACGIGACLGCVVNTKKGYQKVCKEGPVFNADEIIW